MLGRRESERTLEAATGDPRLIALDASAPARAATPRGSAPKPAAVTTWKSTTGTPASRNRRFATSLSMPTAEPSTPAPT